MNSGRKIDGRKIGMPIHPPPGLRRLEEREFQEVTLRDLFVPMLRDWGPGLDLNLYDEALVHFLGGEGRVIRPVDIFDDQAKVGTQKLLLISPGTALRVTALSRDLDAFEDHLQRFLKHTALERIEWVNVERKRVMFRTLRRT